jgi:succinyl-diaminopimelate desuccinylase
MDPLGGIIRKGRLYGLGATDCKGNLACCLEAINSIVEDRIELSYALVFAATADEECGSGLGLIPLLDKKILRPQAAVILDADDFAIIVTQKGLLHLKVKIQGRRAHGAYPWRGINAIDIAIDIIKTIKAANFREARNRFLKGPTINVGSIRGGDKVNVVADWCEFELDFRFLPGMKAGVFLENLKKICLGYTRNFKIEIQGIQEPYDIELTHPLVTKLKEAMLRLRIRPRVQGSEGATVITFFQHKNIPALATGFGSGGCSHSSNEYVKISNLYKGAAVLEEFLKGFKFSGIK